MDASRIALGRGNRASIGDQLARFAGLVEIPGDASVGFGTLATLYQRGSQARG